MIRVRFPGGEVVAFPEGTPEEYIQKLAGEYVKYGGFDAINQRVRLHNLKEDPSYLSLPRLERHKRFNEEAKSSDAYWNQLDPQKRRQLRFALVDVEGANPKETFNYWESPIDRAPDPEEDVGGALDELGNALERSTPKTASYYLRDMAVKVREAFGVEGEIQPPRMPGINYTVPAVTAMNDLIYGTAEAPRHVSEALDNMATDLSVGAELLAPPPKISQFGDVHGWDDFAMYLAQGIGTQIPIMGSIAAAGAIPGVGPVAAYGAGQALETGIISEDLARAGFEGKEADDIAMMYGTMAGVLEAMPVANLLKRVPLVADTFKKRLLGRVGSAFRQAIEEGVMTEPLQTVVERTAVDVAYAHKGDLENVSWLTPEGRKETAWEALEAGIQGFLIGGLMGGGIPGERGPGRRDVEGLSVSAAPEDVGLLPSTGGAGGPVAPAVEPTPEEATGARWGAAPAWLPDEERMAWARGEPFDLEAVVDEIPELTMEQAVFDLSRSRAEVERLFEAPELPAQEEVAAVPTEEEMIAAEMPPTEAPVGPPPVVAPPTPVTEAEAVAPVEERFAAPEAVPYEPTPEELAELGVPPGAVEEAEIDRIAAAEREAGIQPAEAVPAEPLGEVASTIYDRVLESGATSDLIHNIVDTEDRLDAVVTNWAELEGVTEADVDEALTRIRQESQDLLRKEGHGETITVYRGDRGALKAEGTISVSLSERTARSHATPSGMTRKMEIPLSEVISYAEIAGRRETYAEGEIVVPAGALANIEEIGPGTTMLEKIPEGKEFKVPEVQKEPLKAKLGEPVPAGAVEAEPVTFKAKLKAKLRPEEFAQAVGAGIKKAFKKGQKVTAADIQDAISSLTGFGKAGVRINKVREAITELKALGVLEGSFEEGFTVDPDRFDAEGFAVDTKGVRYGREAAEVERGLAEEGLEGEVEQWERERSWKETYRRKIQAYSFIPGKGWIIPEEHEGIHPHLRAPAPEQEMLPGMPTETRGYSPDELMAEAIEAGAYTGPANLDDFVAWLSKEGANLGAGIKPRAKPLKRYMDLGASVRARKPPSLADIRRGFKGWNVRPVGKGRVELSRPGQPILHVQLEDFADFTDKELEDMAFSHNLSVEEMVAKVAAGKVVIKGHYGFDPATGAHVIGLIAPHATPETLYHEAFHFAFHNVLNAKQRNLLIEEYGTEEEAAKAYEKFAAKEYKAEDKLTPAERALKAIKDWALAVAEAVGIEVETAESLMRKVSTGDIYALQEGRYYTRTADRGKQPLEAFENALVSAEVLAEAGHNEARLGEGQTGEAIRAAQADYLERGYHFYSAVSDAIARAQQDTWKPQSFLNWLRKQPGVKEEEIYWTGLEDYVKLVDRVEKADVLKYMEVSGLPLQETIRGEKSLEMSDADITQLSRLEGQISAKPGYRLVFPEEAGGGELRLQIPEGIIPGRVTLTFGDFSDTPIFSAVDDNVRRAFLKAEKIYYKAMKTGTFKAAKWEQYQQPGDRRAYREITLHLPSGGSAATRAGRVLTDALIEAGVDGPIIDMVSQQWGTAEAEFQIAKMNPEAQAAIDRYRSDYKRFDITHESHAFPERNILVWVRFNERFDQEGKRVVFIEEIQSDWHQDGEKKGYLTPEFDAELEAVEDEQTKNAAFQGRLANDLQHMLELAQEKDVRGLSEGIRAFSSGITAPRYWLDTVIGNDNILETRLRDIREVAGDTIADNVEDIVKSWRKANKEFLELEVKRSEMMQALSGMVPYAPFKGSAWPRLAMKRMLVWAAENGFDRIAWTPGRMQIQMWEDATRAVVDHISWNSEPTYGALPAFVLRDTKTGEGYHFNTAEAAKQFASAKEPGRFIFTQPRMEPEGFELALRAYKRDGQEMSFRFKEDGSAVAEDEPTLQEVVGNQVAKRILADHESGEIRGEDITIGGSGFKAFYDGALRNIAKKLGKKYKAEVGTTKIAGMGTQRLALYRTTQVGPNSWVIVRWDDEIMSGNFLTRDEALEAMTELPDYESMEPIIPTGEVHSMDISDELRGQIMSRGLELFDVSPPTVDRLADPDTMYSMETVRESKADENPAAILAPETLTEHIRERAKRFLFNKIGPIFQVQEKLTKLGEDLQEALDGFLKAQNFSARAGALLDWMEINLFDPFINAMNAEGISLQDFDHFRMAAHALERNPRIYAMHVTRPLAQLKKKIKELEDKGLEVGMKIRALDRGNIGTIRALDEDAGVADVFFFNRETGKRAEVTLPISELERDGVTRAKEKIKEIEKMVREDKVPNSGLSDEQAVETLKEQRELGLVEFDGEPTKETNYSGKMGRLNGRFSKIVRWKENTLLKAGLLSKEELDRWRVYRYYSPMRGKDPDIMDAIAGARSLPIPEIEQYGGNMWHRALDRVAKGMGIDEAVFKAGTGRGYNPGRRPATRRALGRTSFPTHSATVELFTDAMEAAVRGEKNRVAKSVWNFVQQFKNAVDAKGEKLFEINRPAMRRIYDEKTGTVKEVADGLSVTKDNVYSIWIDGKLYYIRAISPEMAPFISALNNIGPAEIPRFLRGFTWVNRQMSKLFTSRNPAFAIPNAVRDALTAGIKLAGEKQFKGFGLATMKRAPEAWKLLAEYARRETKGTLDQMDAVARKRIEDFKLAGGETAFWMIPDFDSQARALQKKLQKGRKEGGEGYALHFIKTIIPFLEDYNAAIEGAMRFAVFERAAEMGISRDKGARLARNITVDFTQQGTVARALSPFYIFANASLQGSKMVYDSVTKNPKARNIVLSIIPVAITHAIAMRVLGGDDPEDGLPYWDKVSSYEKSRNIIIMIPGTEGKRIKIPLPWGFNTAWMAGTAIADTAVGATPPADAAARILSSGMSAFNPIGDNDLGTLVGWKQMVMPSWLDPLNDVASNKTFWGGPIRPEKRAYKKSEQYGLEAPDYNNYFSTVSKPSKEFTKFLYKYTGIDINPENLDYLAGGYFGGLGDVVNRGMSLIFSIPKRRTVPMAHELPVIKSFYGDEGTFFAPQQYRGNMADHYYKWETYKELEKTRPQASVAYFQRHRESLDLHRYIQSVEKDVRELKKAGVSINDSRMQKLFKNFNRRYNAIEKKKLKRTLAARK